MSTGTGAHSTVDVDNTSGEHGLEAWRRLDHRLDPAPAQANLDLTSRISTPA